MEKQRASISAMVKRAVLQNNALGKHYPSKSSFSYKSGRWMSIRASRPHAADIAKNCQSGEDSGYDEPMIVESCWSNMIKYPEFEDYDQQVFNVVKKETVLNQKKNIITTTAIVVRDCPENAEEIKEYSQYAKPVLQKANIYTKKPVKNGFSKRKLERNKKLLDAAASDEDILAELWQDVFAAKNIKI